MKKTDNHLLNRREALRLLGAAGTTALVSWRDHQTLPVSLLANNGAIAEAGSIPAVLQPALFAPMPRETKDISQLACVARPAQTEGPYFVDELLNRSDIRSDPATGAVKNAAGQGAATIESVAPGLFAANANGQGVPAAVVQRVKADGTRTFEAVAQFDSAQNRFVPVPIDLGASTDQLFLIGFGTGFRNRSALSAVTAAIGGANAEVLFAWAQGDFAGLDQANIAIPRSLAGRGNVDLVFRVDGKTANTVSINIK